MYTYSYILLLDVPSHLHSSTVHYLRVGKRVAWPMLRVPPVGALYKLCLVDQV